LTSTSCDDIAREILSQCLAGKPPDALPPAFAEDGCAQALFTILVEGLADRFDPKLCDAYVRLFAPLVGADVERYERIRRPRPVTQDPRRVFVLSRITLGADVAVTSVMLAAAKHRFPNAEVVFVGPSKNHELFAEDPRIVHAPINYRRGSLHQRLQAADELRAILGSPDSITIDPDSRLTQLGLIEVCDPDRYYFFESRASHPASSRSLAELAAIWAKDVLGVRSARPYVAVPPSPRRDPYIAVSLGVGENPAKRLADPFECELLALLAHTGMPMWIDRGAGGEESERVVRAIQQSGANAEIWNGSFAGFASIISGARLYAGYDSAGGHVAAACGIPLISVFTGFPVPRMFHRWRPNGPHSYVIRIDQPDPRDALALVERILRNITETVR